MTIIVIVLAYFALLFALSRWQGRRATNETFYRANRQSPWYMVAFGMIGASISGITFVSVPGMVLNTQMTYLQMCMGFILGYVVVAFALLPLYYRLNLHSTLDKGHEEGGSAYANAGSSLRSPPGCSRASPHQKNWSLPTVLLCALTSDFTGGCPPPPSRM